MQLKELLADDDAVSPVIGVILMVAITVILAAVIGTFVLGLGDQVRETSPNAQWDWDQEDVTGENDIGTGTYQATITHRGGQDIDPATLRVAIESDNTVTNYDPSKTANWNGLSSDDKVVAGSSFTLVNQDPDGTSGNDDGVALDSGDTVRLLWESSDGGTSATLTEHQVS